MELGQYHVVETLGSGGFGIVYKAETVDGDGVPRWVALKVLTIGDEVAIDGQARLRDEARLLQRLNHPSIVKVEEVVCLEGRWTLVMEYLDGANLTEVVGRGPIPLSVALNIIAGVADALHYAFGLESEDGHILKMVHRDIKPSNVLVTTDGEVKVLDFGVARADFSGRESDTGVHVLGSMHYLAPERFEGVSGAESDIYSLGVVLFEILVGERMGKCSVSSRRHDAFLHTVRQRLLEALGGAGAGVVEIVVQMLAHSAALRPRADEVRDRALKLLRFLDPLDMAAWAGDVVGGVVDARTLASPDSPEWPERMGRSQWAGRFESTDALPWSTSGNIALDSDPKDSTLSLVFEDGEFTDEVSWTDPMFSDSEVTRTASGGRTHDEDFQDTTVPDIDSVLRHSEHHWDPEDRGGGLFQRPDNIPEVGGTARQAADGSHIIWLVVVGLLCVSGVVLAALLAILGWM